MKTYGGMEAQFHAFLNLSNCLSKPRQYRREKISFPCQESNPNPSAVQPVAYKLSRSLLETVMYEIFHFETCGDNKCYSHNLRAAVKNPQHSNFHCNYHTTLCQATTHSGNKELPLPCKFHRSGKDDERNHPVLSRSRSLQTPGDSCMCRNPVQC
jgi:hypothetical protein